MSQTENALFTLRQEHLAHLKQQGKAFINTFKPKNSSEELCKQFNTFDKASLADKNIPCSIAGRIMLKRSMGKSSFITIQDKNGQIQAYIRQDIIGEEEYAAFNKFDLGDIVGIEGILFKTNTGELSVKAKQTIF